MSKKHKPQRNLDSRPQDTKEIEDLQPEPKVTLDSAVQDAKPKQDAKFESRFESKFESKPEYKFNQAALDRLAQSAHSCFEHIVKREMLFHTLFIALAVVSLIGFLFFFSFLSDSFVMGIFIACFFFGFVLYFVLKLYFQEQKPAELVELRDQYLTQYKAQNPASVAKAARDFAIQLDSSKIDYIALPKFLDFVKPSLEKFLASYHWQDVHLFKELFLRSELDQKLKSVIGAPTDKVAHKELASSYMSLAEHFHTPLDSMNSSTKTSQKFWENYQTFSRLAIEELLIVKEYAPSDLWTSSKLAECYLSLGMLDQAIVEYETILEENEDDPDALFSLGTLYFKQGLHGKGLKIYEQLQNVAPSKAQELIALYGSHDSSNFGNI